MKPLSGHVAACRRATPGSQSTKDGLKRAIKAEWAKITPEMCQKMIEHYWKAGGTLDKCLEAKGARFSKPKLAVVNDDDE